MPDASLPGVSIDIPAWNEEDHLAKTVNRCFPAISSSLSSRQRDADSYLAPEPGSISLVIPAYNEETRLSKALSSYLPILENFGVPFEVIVIADGHDLTPAVAERYKDRHVSCYAFGAKLGRGGAIFEGFRRSQYAVCAFADADGSVPPADAQKILSAVLAGSPAVVASRRLLPETVLVPEGPLRRLIGSVWHSLVRALLGIQVKDAQCGFKAFSRSVVTSIILPRVTITNRTFEVDLLYHIDQAGLPITEVPVHYAHDFDTRMPITKAVPIMFLTLVGIFVFNVLLGGSRTPPRFVLRLNRRFASA